MPANSHYLRFLQLANAVDGMPWMVEVDANEKALFDLICLHWSQNQPLSVVEAINQPQLGSQATLHKRLKRLIAKDWIIARHAEPNRRTKLLTPSERGTSYIRWMSTQLSSMQAVTPTSLLKPQA